MCMFVRFGLTSSSLSPAVVVTAAGLPVLLAILLYTNLSRIMEAMRSDDEYHGATTAGPMARGGSGRRDSGRPPDLSPALLLNGGLLTRKKPMSIKKSRVAKRSEEELLSINQAASLLNVSEASLRRWTDSGRLPCYRVGVQRARRFRREDLVAFISGPSEKASQAQDADQPDDAKPQTGKHTQVAGMDIEYQDHICVIYGRPAGRLKLSVPLFREGLKAGDICFLNATQRAKNLILNVLREVYPDLRTAIKDGQLIFPKLKDNKAEMLDHLEELFLKATYSGERKLRLVGDMEWALSIGWSEQEVYEFELEYNNTLGHRFPIISLCQYDVRVFSGRGILDALKSHEDTYKYPIGEFCI